MFSRHIAIPAFGLLFLSSLASSTAQTAASPQAATITGETFDEKTNAPIPGALVRWSVNGNVQARVTDTNGNFALSMPVLVPREKRLGSLAITLSVQANPYQRTVKAVKVALGRITKVSFPLIRLPDSQIGQITGKVTQANTGVGIRGAIVSILNAGRVISAATRADGTYAISNIGFSNDLTIQVATLQPPCFAPLSHPLAIRHRTMTVNLAMSEPSSYAPPIGRLGRSGCPGLSLPFSPFSGLTLPPDHSLQWTQADVLAIQANPEANAWNSGHINDVIVLQDGSNRELAAADTGGVWLLDPAHQSTVPLSDSWTSHNMTSIAFGPDGTSHLYAATYKTQESLGGVLWETDTSSPAPLSNWLQDNRKPPCSNINRVLVINEARRIVLACDEGVFWSPIPTAPSARGNYQWSAALPAPGSVFPTGAKFWGVAKGAGWAAGPPPTEGTIELSAGGGTANAPRQVAFVGKWSAGNLVLSAAIVGPGTGKFSLPTGRTSLTSCPANLSIMYLVAADSAQNAMVALWKSADDGQTFQQVTLAPNSATNGWWNNVITVSPGNCNTVVVGWNGASYSFDGGANWGQLDDGLQTTYHHLHGDIHGLFIDPSNPNNLYIGSDGGLASVGNFFNGGNFSYQSDYNRKLFDLQAYHVSASKQQSGLMATALQDNGVDYALLPGGPWAHTTDCGCDGGDVDFITPAAVPAQNDILLQEEWSGSPYPRDQAVWNGSEFSNGNPWDIPIGTSSQTVNSTGPSAVIKIPSYGNVQGETMLAVVGFQSTIYGLFARSDGSDTHFEQLGLVGAGENVTAVSSQDGSDIFVGTDQGNIYRLDRPYTAPPVQLAILSNLPGARSVNAIFELFPNSVAFAGLTINGKGFVFGWLGQSWNAVGTGLLPNNLPFSAIEMPDASNLLVISSTQVYLSHDLGNTWFTASDGLPTVSEGTDLHFVQERNGNRFLYLSTYGRSIWRTAVPAPPSSCPKGPNCTSSCMSQCLHTGESQNNCTHDCNCCCKGTVCVSPGNPPGCCMMIGPRSSHASAQPECSTSPGGSLQ